MCIETYSSDVFVFVKQVLDQKCNADVSVMRAFGEQVGHRFIRLVHEIVDDEQHGLATVEIIQVRQTLIERHSRLVCIEQLLVFTVAVYDFRRCRIDHGSSIFQQFKQEPRLPTTRRSGYECGEWVTQRQTHLAVVVVVVQTDGVAVDEDPERRRRVH